MREKTTPQPIGSLPRSQRSSASKVSVPVLLPFTVAFTTMV
jgi:hypothetical protein